MIVLFPNHPLRRKSPDPDYESEMVAAAKAGFRCELFNLELLREGNVTEALLSCSPAEFPGEPLIYRGWMMSEELYSNLHCGLVGKGYQPVTSPTQYAEAHYLPNAYRHLGSLTPASEWIEGRDLEEAWKLYQPFQNSDALIKDWVKSAKHRWSEACFIPAGSTRERFEQIFQEFLSARGNLFEKGVVIRRFHRLKCLEVDLRGQPVHEEYRMFFWQGKLLAGAPPLYGKGPYGILEEWQNLARRFASPFITIDVALEETGRWLVIEVGDGGVSGLPFSIEMQRFFGDLFQLAHLDSRDC